jgi:hypothetical protein
MDKPQLLQDIINNHSDVSIELIQKLAQEEIDRQIKVSIDGMLYKKPLGMLKRLIEYREALILSFREPEIVTVPDDFQPQDILIAAASRINKKRK